jgi:magnesium transporter
VNTGDRTRQTIVRVLTPEGRRDLALRELPAILATVTEPSGPISWVHADLEPPVVDALDKMGLDEIILKSLRGGPERPRVEEFADHLYVSLLLAKASRGGTGDSSMAGESEEEGSSRLDLTELRLFLGSRWLITVGAIDEGDYATLAGRVARQVFSRDRGPSFIVYHICEFLVENLEPVLDGLDERVDALEDEVIAAAGESAVQQLFSLKRDSVELRRRLTPLRDVLQRLGAHGVPYIESEVEVYFRDAHDDIMRDLELLDTYRDILTSALDLHLSSVSNKLNQVMKQLTIVATMFLPLSFIVGLFGTNFFDMPYRNTIWFVIMFVLMFLAALAMFLYTRRRA